MSKRHPLVVGVDDFDACDEQSASVLLRLAGSAPSLPLLLAVTSRKDARGPVITRFRALASALALRPFAQDETRLLMSSLFGEVPNVDALTQWVHRASRGSPRASLEIAQHFVDRGFATYEDGAWTLPASLDELGLPANLDQALDVRIAKMGPLARTLAEALALTSTHSPLRVTEYGALAPGVDEGLLFSALSELVASDILVERGATYVFSHGEVKEAARRAIPADSLPGLHRRLARAYGSERADSRILSAYHLVEAGSVAEAFPEAVESVRKTSSRGGHFARSPEGATLIDSVFEWGRNNGAKPADLELLGRRVLQLASVTDLRLARHGDFLIERLQYDAGLDHWEQFSSTSDPGERARQCIGAAMVRNDATPDAERGMPPLQALHELAGCIATLTGAYVRDLEPGKVRALVPILVPFAPLSPALEVIAEVTSYAADSMEGQAIGGRRNEMLERLAEPLPGLDDQTRSGVRLTNLFYAVMEEVYTGRPGVEDRLAPLDAFPQYVPLAWHARMLAHLFRGEDEKADAARRRRDLASLERADIDLHMELGVLVEGEACQLLGDLIGIKRLLAYVEERATTSPGWISYRELYLAEYHFIRGERDKSLLHYRAAVEKLRGETRYGALVHACYRYARALIEFGDSAQAREIALESIAVAETHRVAPQYRADVHLALAYADATMGKTDAASRADAILAADESGGIFGVRLVNHVAVRARIALKLGDRATFEAMIARVGRLSVESGGKAFWAKHARLLREGSAAGRFEAVGAKASRLGGADASHTTLASDLKTRFDGCAGGGERARLALTTLLDMAASDVGFLYLCKDDEMQLCATTPGDVPPSDLEQEISEWLVALKNETTATISSEEHPVTDLQGAFQLVELSAGKPSELLVVGVAALKSNAGRSRPVPHDLLQALGDNLFDAGDATGRSAHGDDDRHAEL